MASCDTIKQRFVSETGSIEVYFCPECESKFIEFINNTEKPKCAFYDLSSEALIEALKEKDADVLVFEEYYDDYGTIVHSRGLMHNKFCIFEDKVITGSANPTERGLKLNNNNILIIESETISRNYLEEFEEIQSKSESATTNNLIELSGIPIENYFCPEDSCEEKVLRTLNNAEKSIHFMIFTFTSDPIGDLLVSRANEIEIRGILESSQFGKYSEFEKLQSAGIPLKVERTGKNMHNKVFIIDEKIVITGSYNPTKAGTTKNDENILIIHDYHIAQQYMEEFEKIFNE